MSYSSYPHYPPSFVAPFPAYATPVVHNALLGALIGSATAAATQLQVPAQQQAAYPLGKILKTGVATGIATALVTVLGQTISPHHSKVATTATLFVAGTALLYTLSKND